jgi:ribonuclease HI
VLIKAVVQAIPTYTMSCFKLPKKLCIDIEGIIRNFWWGHSGEVRKVHWAKWSTLCHPKQVGGMGFRELQKFNDALLAKQVWRLIHNQSSLFYKVFKAKFFPHCSIMEARYSKHASFAWKSILQARDVIRRGARWRVGNGHSIRIWGDRWLSNSSGAPITPQRILPEDARVSSLIHASTASWNSTLIDQVFFPPDAERIKSLVLSNRDVVDKLIWGGERNGQYSVRSAYRMLLVENQVDTPSCSDEGRWKSFWTQVWSVRVPPKVRHFLWRACSNALPTMANLCKRGITVTRRCSFCQVDDETIVHALWLCPLIGPVWAIHRLARKVFGRHPSTMKDVISSLFEIGLASATAQVLIMIWLIWTRRNKALYQHTLDPLDHIHSLALHLYEDYCAAHAQDTVLSSVQARNRWCPPSHLPFKANFDAALFSDSGMVGIGVVIRDGSGLIIAALCKRFPYVCSVADAEALAAREAIQFALDVGLSEVEVEGDSLIICAALKDSEPSFASYGNIVEDTLVLARGLQRAFISHVKREGNKAAHLLARHAISLSCDCLIWLEDTPAFLESVIIEDLI